MIASHLPRVVGLLGREDDYRYPLPPIHALKNAAAWLYNQNKTGVDRQTQVVMRATSTMDEIVAREGGFGATIAVRRLVTLAVIAVQLARGVASIPATQAWSALLNAQEQHGPRRHCLCA